MSLEREVPKYPDSSTYLRSNYWDADEHGRCDMLGDYVVSLAKKWSFWLFIIFDVIGIPLLVVDVLMPEVPLPTWILWPLFLIAVFCFGVANFQIFAEQEEVKRHLQDHITKLESLEARLKLSTMGSGFLPGHGSRTPPFVEAELDQDGYEPSGIPGWASVWIDVEVENVGYKPGQLEIALDREKSQLAPMFKLHESSEPFINGPTLGELGPQKRAQLQIALDILVDEEDPLLFASTLKELNNYSITLSYSTRRIGGRSPHDHLIVEGNFDAFRQNVIKHWKGYGFENLAEIAEST